MLDGHTLDTDDFRTLVAGPDANQHNPLIAKIRNTTGQPYKPEEDVFLVCSGVVCMSRGAAATLEAYVSGRVRGNVLDHAKKFNWPNNIRLD